MELKLRIRDRAVLGGLERYQTLDTNFRQEQPDFSMPN